MGILLVGFFFFFLSSGWRPEEHFLQECGRLSDVGDLPVKAVLIAWPGLGLDVRLDPHSGYVPRI